MNDHFLPVEIERDDRRCGFHVKVPGADFFVYYTTEDEHGVTALECDHVELPGASHPMWMRLPLGASGIANDDVVESAILKWLISHWPRATS